jgi:hypothetical protein
MSRGQCGGSRTTVNLSFLDRNRYFFVQVSPHLSSQRLSGPRSRPTATQKIWQRRKVNPGPTVLQPGSDSDEDNDNEEWCLLGCYAVWLL